MKTRWKKTPPEMVEFLEEAARPYPAERRVMFGFPVWFVRGNMFFGAFEEKIFLRLGEEDRRRILTESDEAAPFEPMKGRIMREYVTAPESLYADREWLSSWLRRSFDHVSSLPTKAKRAAGGKGRVKTRGKARS